MELRRGPRTGTVLDRSYRIKAFRLHLRIGFHDTTRATMTAELERVMSLPSSEDVGQVRPCHFAGLFLLSLATLLLELALTRVLSVSLWYHFGFLVISTALLGFGASGVTLALWTRLRERENLDLGLGVCGLAFAGSVVFSF